MRRNGFHEIALISLLCVSSALFARRSAGQDLLAQSFGSPSTPALGAAMTEMPDLDGDGIRDVAAAHGASALGAIDILSGKDLQVIRSFPAPGGVGNNGALVSIAEVGDLDGDGTPDLALGFWADGRVDFVSGAGGAAIGSLSGIWYDDFGHAIVRAGDADLDGRDDIAISSPAWDNISTGKQNAGRVEVYSAATFARLWTFDGTLFGEWVGWDLARLKDRDGDGVDDLVAGAPGTFGEFSGRGFAHVISGATGTLIQSISGEAPNMNLGSAVDDGGDVDGDGVPDLAVTVSTLKVSRVYSGQDGSILSEFGAGFDSLGAFDVLKNAGDVDLDSVPDFAVIEFLSIFGSDLVRMYSGASGDLLFTSYNYIADFTPGVFTGAIATPGDVDGDGRADIVASWPGKHTPQTLSTHSEPLGEVRLLGGCKSGGFRLVGQSCLGLATTQPTLRLEGCATPGGEIRGLLAFDPTPPRILALVAGTGVAETPLPYCTLYIANPVPALWVQNPDPLVNTAEFKAQIPPGFSGKIVLQAIVFSDPMWWIPVASSNAVEIDVK